MSNEVVPIGVAEPATVINKPKRVRGPLNQGHARELNRAEFVALAAQQSGRTAALAVREVDATFVSSLLADCDEARTKLGEAVNNTTAHRTATAAEQRAAKGLEAALREVQKAAKQKYARTNRIALADYFIGQRLNGSQPNLAQTSQTIIGKLANDELPGITTAKEKALGTLRQAWMDANEAQATAETAALDARAELTTMLKSIKDRRMAIQWAADAEWPHEDSEHAATRKEFALPPRRPLPV